MAGTIAEIARETLRTDFRRIDTKSARIVLIEAGPRILPSFDADLAAYAHGALERLGVRVELGRPVRDCNGDGVVFDTTLLPAKTIIWAAGVAASPAAAWLGAPADRADRVKVLPDLTVPDNPNIFVIGDTATIESEDGKLVPGIAPAAKQEGRYVANTIGARLADEPSLGPFRYHDAGSLATIGKSAAIIDFGWIKFRGWIAWMLWGLAHIYFLIGVRNRLAVALNWFWIYLTGARSARLITQTDVEGDRN
jgi:NADH dehydrogenase